MLKPNVIIDTKGLFCPMPVIKTSEAIGNIEVGAVIEVIADDPAIEYDLPAWCKSHGHTIESEFRDGPDYHYFVRKSGG